MLKLFFRDDFLKITSILFFLILIVRIPITYGFLARDDIGQLYGDIRAVHVYLSDGRYIPAFFLFLIDEIFEIEFPALITLRVLDCFALAMCCVAFVSAMRYCYEGRWSFDFGTLLLAGIPAGYPLLLENYSFAVNSPLRLVQFLSLSILAFSVIRRNYYIFSLSLLIILMNYQSGIQFAAIVTLGIIISRILSNRDEYSDTVNEIFSITVFAFVTILTIATYLILIKIIFPYIYYFIYSHNLPEKARTSLQSINDLGEMLRGFKYLIRNVVGNFRTPAWPVLPAGLVVTACTTVAGLVALPHVLKIGFSRFAILLVLTLVLGLMSGNIFLLILDLYPYGPRTADHFGFALAIPFCAAVSLAQGRFSRRLAVATTSVMASLYLYASASAAAGAALYADHERLLVNRAVARLESSQGYVPGETAVAFVGTLSADRDPPLRSLRRSYNGVLMSRLAAAWSLRPLFELVAGYKIPAAKMDAEVAKAICETSRQKSGRAPLAVERAEPNVFVVCLY